MILKAEVLRLRGERRGNLNDNLGCREKEKLTLTINGQLTLLGSGLYEDQFLIMVYLNWQIVEDEE